MCLDKVFHMQSTSSQPSDIHSVTRVTYNDSFEWRLLKCVFKTLTLVGATFSSLAFFSTGEPISLVFSTVFSILTVALFTYDDDPTAPPHVINRSALPIIISPQSASPSQIYSQRFVRRPSLSNLLSNPSLYNSPVVTLPYGHAFSNDHVPVGRQNQPSFSSFSASPDHTLVGRTQEPFPFSSPTSFVSTAQEHAPVGRRQQQIEEVEYPEHTTSTTFFGEDDDHAPVGER